MTEHFKVKNNQIFITAVTSGGMYTADQLKKIADVCQEYSLFVKNLENQQLGFTIDEDKLSDVTNLFLSVGLEVQPYQKPSQKIYPKSCLGALCPLFQQDALADSIELTQNLSQKFKDKSLELAIGLNGCAKSCVHAGTDDFCLVGDENGYKVYIGGKTSEIPQFAQFAGEGLKKEKLFPCVSELIEIYLDKKEGDEKLYETIERIGMQPFIEALEKWSNEPIEAVTEQGESQSLTDGVENSSGIIEVSINSNDREEIEVSESKSSPSASIQDKDDLSSFEELNETQKDTSETSEPLLEQNDDTRVEKKDESDFNGEESLNASEPQSELSEEPVMTEEKTSSTSDISKTNLNDDSDEDSISMETQNPKVETDKENNITDNIDLTSDSSDLSREEVLDITAVSSKTRKSRAMGVKVSCHDGALEMNVEGMGSFTLPLDEIGEGSELEIEMDGLTIRISHSGEAVHLSYGAVSLTFPV